MGPFCNKDQSDYSTFKAQLRAVERPATTEWERFKKVTEAMLEENFSRIEAEIAKLMHRLPPMPLPPNPNPGPPEPGLADDFYR